MRKEKKGKLALGKLVSAILLCEGVGILGSVATFQAIPSWYTTLEKPFFSPPSWVFGPVWVILYFLMGISLYRVWMKKKNKLTWFWVQLVLNGMWSFLFFGFHWTGISFIEILLLWGAIVFTMKDFWKVDKWAAKLLFPYLFWVGFASLLNFSLWLLN